MANRYQSIYDNLSTEFLMSLRDAPVHQGHWTITDGKLTLIDEKGEHFQFDYERGDALSDLLVDFLNNLPALASTARTLK